MRFADAKAIETKYKGYRFRSRLEARWAVYFDAITMKWEYEPEGFDLGDGVAYLPDFWLPQVKMFAEVKPEEPTPEEITKATRLCAKTGCALFFLNGQPSVDDYWAVFSTDKIGGVGWKHYPIAPYLNCLLEWGEEDFQAFPNWKTAKVAPRKNPVLDRAVSAARSARFEFGESPSIPTGPSMFMI